jgi:hypothetical protein
VVDRGDVHIPRPSGTDQEGSFWEQMVVLTPLHLRPSLIIELWSDEAAVWTNGPSTKLSTTRWRTLKYQTHCQVITSTSVGGAIAQNRLTVVRVRDNSTINWAWAARDQDGPPRPMSNLLTPPGLLPWRSHQQHPPHHLTQIGKPLTDPMPWPKWSSSGPWILTEKGYRTITHDELATGLGVTKPQRLSEVLFSTLQRTTSVFIFEYLSQCVSAHSPQPRPLNLPNAVPDELSQVLLDRFRKHSPHTDVLTDADTTFDWAPPDLTEGGEWYTHRVATLRLAASHYPGREIELLHQGLLHLDTHRSNYDATGPRPTSLQLLWWEFPREHWDALRDGSSMNFLVPPVATLHPNAEMTPEQAKIAGEFVDELVDLNVAIRPQGQVLTTSPMFCLEKDGFPGTWRVLSNMREGGQNEAVGADPVFLPRVSNILERLYTGGYTAVVDASKFFYQFKTHPDDQPYLGMIHPITGEYWVYNGLPMGAANSPALGGRYGMAFLRLLRLVSPDFIGTPTANCWWTGFMGTGYDPDLGYGLVLTGPSGAPAVLVYAFVDDFFVHGVNKQQVDHALRSFLDLTVQVGLLCHPKKLFPPARVQKYIGFIFDTTGIPTLRVPTAKREKALAMVDYVRNSPSGYQFSRLALSVVTGTLESLVEATPSRIGHTYLRRFHSLVHPEGFASGPSVYYTHTAITDGVREDLKWWQALLNRDIARTARSAKAGVLIPSWGDGSGTGTGGTIQVPDGPLAMWMGKWTPFVFHHSSNWKELKTLLLTLQALRSTHSRDMAQTTIFYFTDNSTTYWVCSSGSSRSPGLHTLVEQIKLLELELNIDLQVIHVPGVAMIQQGTDGLSRGIWASELHPYADQGTLTASVFAPCGPSRAMVAKILADHDVRWPSWALIAWDAPHDPYAWIHHNTAWFPPPELARQCLCAFMEVWVESPGDTAALFVVPRVLAAFWHNLSRHITELCTIPANELPYPPVLPIPVVVLYIPPHVRSLAPHRTELDAHQPPGYRQHKREADEMRGLLPAVLDA